MKFKFLGTIWDFSEFVGGFYLFLLPICLIGYTFMLPHAPWPANAAYVIICVIYGATVKDVEAKYYAGKKA